MTTTHSIRTADRDGSGGAGPLRVVLRFAGTILSNGKARIGAAILGLFLLVGIFAPLLSPYDPNANDFASGEGASAAHWLGTTAAGEDVLSQLLHGAQVSLLVGFVAGGASTSNRNFEGRQGAGGRTHLVSPAMAAAAAVTGRFIDVRELIQA